METAEMTPNNVHQGHNVRIAREVKGIKQEVLAEQMKTTQPTISKHENSRIVEDGWLEKYAEALGVSIDFLKTWEENAKTIVFESNVVNNQDNAGTNTHVGYTNDNNNAMLNPLDKVTELYERLLKEKDEKYTTLEKRVQNLEKLLSDR